MAGTTPRRLLLVIVPLVAVVPASAKDYMVGDSSGWKSGVDYAAWAKGKPFAIGDTLSFQYSSAHSVLEVSEADHGACSPSNPLRSHQGQSTTIPLTKAGTRYFICGAPGHCASGMKVAITVSGGGGGSSSSADNTATPSGPSVRATNTKPASGAATTTAESDSSAAGSGARLAMGLLFGAAGLAAIMG